MSRRTLALAGSLALCLGSAVPLRAQNTYVTQLQGYMNNYATQAMGAGFNALQPMVTGSLGQGAATNHNVTLNGGTSYLIIGVCDRDCSDVDLSLSSPDGRVIASDVALDDHPMLRFSAPTSGSYSLRVSMATCRVAPCYYGVQLFGGAGYAQPVVAAPTTMGAPNAMGMIGVNQQVTGTLTTMDIRYNGKPIQAWGFSCNAGQQFQMDVLSSWDNYAIVFDPMGNQVAQDDDTGESLNARISYTCPQPGTYRLGVTTYNNSTTPGPYTLQVQSAMVATPQPMPMPTPMTPQPMPQPMTPQPLAMSAVPGPGQVGVIQAGATSNGRLETGDQQMNDGTWADVWQFQGQAGQAVTIELRSEEFDTYLQLIDAAGTRLAEDDDSLGNLDSRIVFRLPSSGMFQIVVNNFGDSRRAGAYQLTLR